MCSELFEVENKCLEVVMSFLSSALVQWRRPELDLGMCFKFRARSRCTAIYSQ